MWISGTVLAQHSGSPGFNSQHWEIKGKKASSSFTFHLRVHTDIPRNVALMTQSVKCLGKLPHPRKPGRSFFTYSSLCGITLWLWKDKLRREISARKKHISTPNSTASKILIQRSYGSHPSHITSPFPALISYMLQYCFQCHTDVFVKMGPLGS